MASFILIFSIIAVSVAAGAVNSYSTAATIGALAGFALGHSSSQALLITFGMAFWACIARSAAEN